MASNLTFDAGDRRRVETAVSYGDFTSDNTLENINALKDQTIGLLRLSWLSLKEAGNNMMTLTRFYVKKHETSYYLCVAAVSSAAIYQAVYVLFSDTPHC